MNPTTLEVTGRNAPPSWAVRQRDLIAMMNRAAVPFVDHATRPDGTLKWRSEWTSMDGTDNAYEAFLSFPLFYLLGGGDEMDALARREWDAITRQFTDYGTVERGFVTGFDWFHHSESYTYIYYLALSDPRHQAHRQQALDYAAMYIGEDPLAPNWDAEHRMLRSPLNGSRGPRFVTTQQDWDYHRPILSGYLVPYEDTPGVDSTDPLVQADWKDDEMFAHILRLANERMTRGDVPLNMSSTSLVTNAYIHTGDDRYRQWVLEYLQAWMDRRDQNDGIVPDNIGPNGQLGELMNGKWWGGYYGWRWPHGARNVVEPAVVAGGCAMLMTGDDSWLDLARSQLDLLWSLRREEDGITKVPARHGDQGWFDYRAPEPILYVQLYALTRNPADLARLEEAFPSRAGFDGLPPDWGASKAGICPPMAWFAYMEGRHPDYPAQILDSTYGCSCQALDRLEADDTDPETRECYHFQNKNPVVPEGLIQMSMGTPGAVYNGGLLHAAVRYFDPDRARAGLPEHVAALVDRVTANEVSLTLVNTDPVAPHTVGIQAGAFREHEFVRARTARGEEGTESTELGNSFFQVQLGPAAQTRMRLEVRRHVHGPTYEFPAFE